METQYIEVVRTGITDRYAVTGINEDSWNTFFDMIIKPLIDAGAKVKPPSESEFLEHPMRKSHIFYEVEEIGLVVHYMTEWKDKTDMENWLQAVSDLQQLYGQAPL